MPDSREGENQSQFSRPAMRGSMIQQAHASEESRANFRNATRLPDHRNRRPARDAIRRATCFAPLRCRLTALFIPLLSLSLFLHPAPQST